MPTDRSKRRTRRARRIPKGQRVDVTRAEFNRVIDILNERGEILNALSHNQDLQFKRIAQLQAEVDAMRRTLGRLEPA